MTIAGQMIARAWVDPTYCRLLLDDARAAANLYPGPVAGHFILVCVEQTDDLHNLIVCTPCSCYPVDVIGQPPDWYKTADYRTRAVSDPRSLLSDLGCVIPPATAIQTHDSDYRRRYMVLPKRPVGTEEWTETQLSDLIDQHNVVGAAIIPPQ